LRRRRYHITYWRAELFLGADLNTSTPVALDEMEQTSNVRHCGLSLQPDQATESQKFGPLLHLPV
jgi:hypothetical protein